MLPLFNVLEQPLKDQMIAKIPFSPYHWSQWEVNKLGKGWPLSNSAFELPSLCQKKLTKFPAVSSQFDDERGSQMGERGSEELVCTGMKRPDLTGTPQGLAFFLYSNILLLVLSLRECRSHFCGSVQRLGKSGEHSSILNGRVNFTLRFFLKKNTFFFTFHFSGSTCLSHLDYI